MKERKSNIKPDKNFCCICGKRIVGCGHNPHPIVKEEGYRCCDKCNIKVIEARIKQLHKEGEQ